jgi:hypothetical protein
MARIKVDRFVANVAKTGHRRIISVPAYIDGFEPGTKVEVKKVK